MATTETASPQGRAALSPRELQVLDMLSTGMTNEEIARRLFLSIHAVKFHLGAIYRKLGVGNRTEAAATYLRQSLADTDHSADAAGEG